MKVNWLNEKSMYLYRPVGLNELALIYDSNMLKFPPRLPEQPIFYPVLNQDYASNSQWVPTFDQFYSDSGFLKKHVVLAEGKYKFWSIFLKKQMLFVRKYHE